MKEYRTINKKKLLISQNWERLWCYLLLFGTMFDKPYADQLKMIILANKTGGRKISEIFEGIYNFASG